MNYSTEKKSAVKSLMENVMKNYFPQEDTVARIAFDGTVVVKTNTANGKEWLGFKDDNVVSYPEPFIFDGIPVYHIAKKISDIKKGDIIKSTSSTYTLVERVNTENGKVYGVTFGGNVRKMTPIKDFLMPDATLRVVVNPLGSNLPSNMASILPFLYFNDGDNSDMEELFVMSSVFGANGGQGIGNLLTNPMALAALCGKGNKKMLMMLMMQQNGGLNLFGTPAPEVKPAVVKVEEEVAE